MTEYLSARGWLPDGGLWCAGGAAPVVITPGQLRGEAVRLLPPVAVAAAPADGRTLVNVQTILWAATAVDRDLGVVTVVGQRVGIRAHLVSAAWAFGDGTSALATSPGRPYTTACGTVLCPDYFGHVYTTRAKRVVSLVVTWQAQFEVGGAGWRDIPGTVTGPASTLTVSVTEARSVLVTDPIR